MILDQEFLDLRSDERRQKKSSNGENSITKYRGSKTEFIRIDIASKMPLYEQWWFWMILIGIIVIILACLLWAIFGILRWWFWVLLIIGIIVIIIGIVWWAIERSKPEEIYMPVPTSQGPISQGPISQGPSTMYGGTALQQQIPQQRIPQQQIPQQQIPQQTTVEKSVYQGIPTSATISGTSGFQTPVILPQVPSQSVRLPQQTTSTNMSNVRL